MGYYTRNNGQIRCFEPDDTETSFYIEHSANLDDIFAKAKERFGDHITLSDLRIESKYIHTDCLTYDLHDPGDWTYYLLITLITD